ncbi:AAA ATPase-like domain-containing protein [Desulfonema limicola]|uniref:non-specific protein-tyrosine kinase n=1 Tax=Desulfonema limicola TaxID=45656 RepID=A0A975GJE4_9BACT|nr:CpsD/CapB family tyrosine-protein kinase [Desulfonema limicola]QTA83337.1 AAA ATPase-like domain-containing protein [Desulfonema limicola]
MLGLPVQPEILVPKTCAEQTEPVCSDGLPLKLIPGKKHALWMITPERCPRVLETFRTFKNSIIFFNENQKKVFLITGAESKVGVSTIALNFSIVLSRDLPEKRILFVDTNIDNPCLNKIFAYSQDAPCLMDYLLKKVPLNAIIHSSCFENLNLVFSSKIKEQKLYPFNIEIFVQFLNQVRPNYDFIILDSAPALTSSHTRSIYSRADGVILVVEANRTRTQVIAEFQRQLREDKAHLLGSFLNKRRFFIPKWLYRFI